MFKNLLVIIAIFSLFSCKLKVKSSEDFSEYKEPAIEQEEQFEEIATAEEAVKINEETEKEIEEIEVKDRVLFGYDSAALTSEAEEILNVQSEWLKSDPSIKIVIEGHCDERGTREYNIALGEKRANSAKQYLVNKGVLESRIKIISYGKERPAFFGDSPEVMAKNRRAVVVVE
jgi:peptidoglycan-associated lipoprotein